MMKYFNSLKFSYFLMGMLVLTSIAAWLVSDALDITMAYNDAMSHLNLSRLVFDNREPGMTQIGGVWLPMSHILPLMFIWNDWWWSTGLAASIFSMISYVISVWAIYASVRYVTTNRWAAVIGASVMALNLNMLYVQATPLTEPLYLLFFCLSCLIFISWVFNSRQVMYLIMLGALGFFQVLTRYDGWFVVACEGLLILIYLWRQKANWGELIGKLFIFGLPVAFGIGLWLLWNLLIFGDAFFFAFGPYSARAQQGLIESKVGLLTKHDVGVSIKAYSLDVVANVGLEMSILALIGAVVYLFSGHKKGDFMKRSLVICLLAAPVLFNILALYLGFSILNIPELNWNPSMDIAGNWFNVRYGLLALPLLATTYGILAANVKTLGKIMLVMLIFVQQLIIWHEGVITVVDGTMGSSSFENQDISAYLQEHVTGEDLVLMSNSFFNAVAFRSQIDLKRYIHEGVSQEWDYALAEPEKYADWIVMANGDIGEPVYISLVKNQQLRFLGYYEHAFKGLHGDIYKKKETGQLFVYREGTELFIGDKPFMAEGVNSYDLSYQTENSIDKTFKELHAIGVNTVRFWLFGDGVKDGFQPKAGVISEERLKRADYIIASANRYNIRLIPVLINNWDDYGGKKQYLNWLGKYQTNTDIFFTDSDAKQLAKNYINHILSRKNSYTGIAYVDEPAIMAWDIMNEPRSIYGNYDLIRAWSKEFSAFVKERDPNHLVMVGTETPIFDPVFQKGGSGVCDFDEIDICSMHLYLYEENKLILKDMTAVEKALDWQIIYAQQQIKKPIIMGEIGIEKNLRPFGRAPELVLEEIVDSAFDRGINGIFIWNWAQQEDKTYGFSPTTDEKNAYSLETLKKILH